MKQTEFFEFSMSCENHYYVMDGDVWKDWCEITNRECKSFEDCPEVDDRK